MTRRTTVNRLETSRLLAEFSFSHLADAARAGDEAAIVELDRRTAGRARAAATGFCRDADADDAVAEGFSRALARLDQLVDPAAVEAWLIRCVIRAAIDLSRQYRRQRPTGDLGALQERAVPAAESAADRALTLIDERSLATVVSQLEPGTRQLLLLRYHAGMSVRRIAAALGRPDGTVRRQFVEAHRMAGEQFLGRQLRPAGGECSTAVHQLCRSPYRTPSVLARRRLDEHLRGCRACRDRQAELWARLAELGLRRRRGPGAEAA